MHELRPKNKLECRVEYLPSKTRDSCKLFPVSFNLFLRKNWVHLISKIIHYDPILGQQCTAEWSYTDYSSDNTEDTEYSNNFGNTFNSKSLPSNCEVRYFSFFYIILRLDFSQL